MSKKIILVLVGIFLFLGWNVAKASVVIDEIMYAPINGGAEWIEIFNSGGDSVDLTDWRFFNNATDSAPLRLQKGSAVLSGGNYAIITSSDDWSSFSGTVFSSSQFSLPNDSSKYNTYKAISDSNKQIIDSVTYTTSVEATGTGDSLQFIDNKWQVAPSTPNAQNYVFPSADSDTSESDNVISSGLNSSASSSSSSTQSLTQTQTKINEAPSIKTEIQAKTIAFVGIPILFNASATGYSNELLSYGKYFWNFGDGDSKEVKASDATKFTHTFYYAGDYTVSLEYYINPYSNSDNPDASDKITIKVVPADISISNVGDEKDFFVEISNNTSYDADLSNWVLGSAEKSFTLPKNTILKSKSKIIISPKITGFSILDKDTLNLLNGDGEMVFAYAAPLETTEVSAENTVPASASASLGGPIKTSVKTEKENNTNKQLPADNLGAEAIKTVTNTETNTNTQNNLAYEIGLFIFLGASATATYFIRSRNRKIVSEQNGNDFEIIDE